MDNSVKKRDIYVQCKLGRHFSKENQIEWKTCWIPKKFSIRGNFLKVKQDGEWENGWEVVEVYTESSWDELNERSRDHLSTRQFSDI